MRKSSPSTRSRLIRGVLATGAVTAIVLSAATPALAAAVTLTLSSTSGPSAGGNTITGTSATAPSPGFASGNAAQFTTATACPTAYAAPTTGTVAVTTYKALSATKIAVVVPAGVTFTVSGTATSTKWMLCVYASATAAAAGPPAVTAAPLIASAPYSVTTAPTFASSNYVSPTSAPALGGTKITVTGTGFPATGLTASIGGTPLTGITVSSDGTSFTATVPAHSPGTNQTLSITTPGGTINKTGAFTFANGIVVSPNTAPASGTADIDVTGVGFSSITFASAATSGHVYLVKGAYDPTDNAGAKTNPATTECANVLPISDGELICTLTLGSVANGAYTMTVVSNGGVDVQPAVGNTAAGANYDPTAGYSQSVISSGSTFTVAPF